ncbi:uncharacterized protein LOC144437795 [Glandiceps talaboti]
MARVTFRGLLARLSTSNVQFFTVSGQSTRHIACITFYTRIESAQNQNCSQRIKRHDMSLGEQFNCRKILQPHIQQLSWIQNTRYFSTQSESKHNDHDEEEIRQGKTNTKTKMDVKSNTFDKVNAKSEDKVASKKAETQPVYDIDSEDINKLSLWQRYKILLKQYAKVMIPVHVFTSSIWYGTFYYTVAHSGIDVVPFLQRFLTKIGLGESILHSINTPTASSLLIAYAMYKIATPARYTVTLGGTTFMVRYLRNKGHIDPAPPKDQTLREAMKESMTEMKDNYEKTKQNVKK